MSRKFKVGDIVIIREWDDMKNEYGLDANGNICAGMGDVFTPSMKNKCGKTYKIKSTNEETGLLRLYDCGWNIYTFMVKHSWENGAIEIL